MNSKEQVLKIFLSRRGDEISGEDIANTLGISRSAVWKIITGLRESGYNISASTNRGYIMRKDGDILSDGGISEFLDKNASDFYKTDIRLSVTSTNALMKVLAEDGAAEGYVIAAESQSAGRGRMGRSFYSPHGTGLYMSILLRPKILATEALSVTTAAAVAVTDALRDVCGTDTRIKWVNDIYHDSKKICGILTEASLDFESGGVDYAILGIGINISPPENGYPPELRDIAGAVYGCITDVPCDIRSKLCAGILNAFLGYYRNISDKSYMKLYRERSFVIGETVYAVTPSSKEQVTVLDIDDNAGLVVKTETGKIKTLSSGEISIRRMK